MTRAAPYDRVALATLILDRLQRDEEDLRRSWAASGRIPHLVVDAVLPESIAKMLSERFPAPSEMTLKKSLAELKLVSAQMDRHDPLLEETLFAFQDPRVVSCIERLTHLTSLRADAALYAGGISAMGPGHYLQPHLDNSHDLNRRDYRALNLLYYVSPGWRGPNGANLELWPDGPSKAPVTIVSEFNRLVVMATHAQAWHSVSRNVSSEMRCCISNYYFSPRPVTGEDYSHVTRFRGRPGERVRDVLLRTNAALRTLVRKLVPAGIRKTRHYYQRDASRETDRLRDKE